MILLRYDTSSTHFTTRINTQMRCSWHVLVYDLRCNTEGVTKTPNPPWSFGVHTTSHLVNRYFFLWSSLYQKNRDMKWSSFFITPQGTSKKENINIRRLLKIELIKTSPLLLTSYFSNSAVFFEIVVQHISNPYSLVFYDA